MKAKLLTPLAVTFSALSEALRFASESMADLADIFDRCPDCGRRISDTSCKNPPAKETPMRLDPLTGMVYPTLTSHEYVREFGLSLRTALRLEDEDREQEFTE